MEEAIQTLQKLAKALKETYETINTAILWKEALNIVQSIENWKNVWKNAKNAKMTR
jgi:hypothetical protein